jgi:hypothetical protein
MKYIKNINCGTLNVYKIIGYCYNPPPCEVKPKRERERCSPRPVTRMK